jgi:hypothetical protein
MHQVSPGLYGTARIAKELFPGLVEIDPAQAAFLALTVLVKIKANGDGK